MLCQITKVKGSFIIRYGIFTLFKLTKQFAETPNGIKGFSIKDFSDTKISFCLVDFSQYLKILTDNIAKNFTMDCNQIIFLTSGEVRHKVDFNTFYYSAKNIFTVFCNQVQDISASPDAQGFVIIYTNEFIEHSLLDIQIIENFAIFENLNVNKHLILDDSSYNALLGLSEQIKFEISYTSNFARSEMLNILLRSFFLQIERIKEQYPNKKSSNIDYLTFLKLRNLIEENFYKERNVSFYADSLFVTPKKINSLSKIYLGIPIKLALELRAILEIKRLLIYSNSSLKEIGANMGFKEPTNFNKFFKKIAKQTPNEFRYSNN